MTHITCRLTAMNQDQLRNPTLGNPFTAQTAENRKNRTSAPHIEASCSTTVCAIQCLYVCMQKQRLRHPLPVHPTEGPFAERSPSQIFDSSFWRLPRESFGNSVFSRPTMVSSA